jgi:hypothetical protein
MAARHRGRRRGGRWAGALAAAGVLLVVASLFGVAVTLARRSPATLAGSPPAASSTAAVPAPTTGGPTVRPPTTQVPYAAPPANVGFDYQLSEAYPVPAGVRVVSRDYSATPAPGIYTMCYVNAYQSQPEEEDWWKRNHDDLLLRNNGRYVIDENWNEIVFDISTEAKRTRLAAIVVTWMKVCARKGFQAVEPDNLDSWTRSEGRLTPADAVAYGRRLADGAHALGMAIGQKNTPELGRTGRDVIGFDFALAEECADFDECQEYIDVYGGRVFVIEYDDVNFKKACDGFGSRLSIVRRDVQVTWPGSPTYVFRAC